MLSKPGTILTMLATKINKKMVATSGITRLAHLPVELSTAFHKNSKIASKKLLTPLGTMAPLLTKRLTRSAIQIKIRSAIRVASMVFVKGTPKYLEPGPYRLGGQNDSWADWSINRRTNEGKVNAN